MKVILVETVGGEIRTIANVPDEQHGTKQIACSLFSGTAAEREEWKRNPAQKIQAVYVMKNGEQIVMMDIRLPRDQWKPAGTFAR